MAEVFAPFPIQGTMCHLTFYMMEGRNFVRKKSSLTRRKVLYSPKFARTRHNASIMAKASKIGSRVYNALPAFWRQGWMYRSFTGEAYTMLKARKKEEEIQQLLMQRYVGPVVNKQPKNANFIQLGKEPRRAYRKLDTAYWRKKTFKAARRKARKEQTLYHASILARASKIGSKLYARSGYRCRSAYQRLTAWAMKLLKDEWDESDIIAMLLPQIQDQPETFQLSTPAKNTAGTVVHPDGQYYFITSLYRRFEANAINTLPATCYSTSYTNLLKAPSSQYGNLIYEGKRPG